MIGFNKQPESVVPNTGHDPVSVPSPVGGPVYTMPDRFHPQAYSSSNKPIIIAASVLAIVVLGMGAYFAYSYWNKMQADILAEEQRSQQAIIADLNTVPPPVTLPIAPTVTTSTIATTTPATTTAATTTAPVVEDISATLRISTDTDRDGLTDVEEQVIGSSSTNPDTDGDSYRDGLEIANGYNPLLAGSSDPTKLPNAKFVTSTATTFVDNNFATLIPVSWSVTSLSANRQLTIAAETGEIVKITAKSNVQSLSPSAAMLQVYPQLTIGQLTPITAGQLSGVVSPNGLIIYLVDQGRSTIYTIEYIKEPAADWRYPSLLMMIAKNMRMIDRPVTPQASTNSTNTTSTTNGQ